jgi:hypothetical protein
MTSQEIKEYFIKHNFTETERNTFSKSYDGGITIIYKINKEVINCYYKTFNRKIKRLKARIKNLSVNSDGTLNGFKPLLAE